MKEKVLDFSSIRPLIIEKRLDVLNWIYPKKFDTRHEAVRKPRGENSGNWFLKLETYCKWINDSSPTVLFCHGMRNYLKSGCGLTLFLAGAGKSVIMYVLSHLVVDIKVSCGR